MGKAKGEMTRMEILRRLGPACPDGSFRTNALECGVLQRARKEIVHGRWTLFFPPDSVDTMARHINEKAGRGGKAAADGEQA
jgi:hypothetical protein